MTQYITAKAQTFEQISKIASDFWEIPEDVAGEALGYFMMNVMPMIQKDYDEITTHIIQDEFMLWLSCMLSGDVWQ